MILWIYASKTVVSGLLGFIIMNNFTINQIKELIAFYNEACIHANASLVKPEIIKALEKELEK